jgi:hypothetical protein
MEVGLWDTIKSIGSIGGLVSAGFLVYDRLVKDRPIINLSNTTGVGGKKWPAFQIVNPGRTPIIITSVRITPKILKWYDFDSEKGDNFLRYMYGLNDYLCIIQTGEFRKFHVEPYEDLPSLELYTSVEIVVGWRRLDRPRRWQMPLRVTVSPHELLEIAKV